jgi:hypothetical protein
VWETADDYLLRVILSPQLTVCIRTLRTTICSEKSDNRICAAAAATTTAAALRVFISYVREYGAW